MASLRLVSQAGSANTVTARVFVAPDDASDQNGVVVKIPSADWGDPDADEYGTGQAFMLLKEGSGGTEPDDFVIYRVDHKGGIGASGGMHLATGMRLRAADADDITYSVHIDPTLDVTGIIVDAANDAPASAWQQWRLNDTTVVAEIAATGSLFANRGLSVGSGAAGTQATLTIKRDPAGGNDGQLVAIAATNAIATGTAVGDVVLRAVDTADGTGKLLLVGHTTIGLSVNATGIGFFTTAPQAKKTVTGSRGGNAALASLLTQLAGYGLVTDSSSA